jgi:hypothetical protein
MCRMPMVPAQPRASSLRRCHASDCLSLRKPGPWVMPHMRLIKPIQCKSLGSGQWPLLRPDVSWSPAPCGLYRVAVMPDACWLQQPLGLWVMRPVSCVHAYGLRNGLWSCVARCRRLANFSANSRVFGSRVAQSCADVWRPGANSRALAARLLVVRMFAAPSKSRVLPVLPVMRLTFAPANLRALSRVVSHAVDVSWLQRKSLGSLGHAASWRVDVYDQRV